MSKKIIYLLSLLMALSLVFTSCKKDGDKGITDPGGIPGENQEEDIKNDTGGVADNWEDLDKYSDKPMQDYAVIDETIAGNDYYRNPVIVALGGKNVLIVTEKRIGYKGSENDIGVNGEDKSDIVYLLSSDGGDSFSTPKTVGSPSTGGNDAVCSPIVYYQKPSTGNTAKIYILASSGAGLSRTDTLYENRNPQSKYRYIVGTVSGTDAKASIDWTSGWQDLIFNHQLPVRQYGTHSARGVIADNGDLILPVIRADQGDNNNPKELMEVQFRRLPAGNISIGTQIGIGFHFYQENDIFGKHKETSVTEYTSSGGIVHFMAVPSEERMYGSMYIGKTQNGGNGVTSLNTTLVAAEGSFGFLKIDNGWYGTQQYDPQKYATSPSSAGVNGSTASTERLYSHVATKAGEASYLYMLNYSDVWNSASYTLKSGRLQIAKTSKSSSIDILPDGTIIMATEKERYDADGFKFNIFFSRYTQKYLAKNIK